MTRDLYALLGVASDASAEEIAAVCARKLEEATDNNDRVVLRHARDVLCNPTYRASHDMKLREQREPGKRARPRLPEPESMREDGPRYKLVVFLVIGLAVLGLVGWLWTKKTPKPPTQVVSKSAATVLAAQGRPTELAAPPQAAGVRSTGPLDPQRLYAAVSPSVVLVESLNAYGAPYASGSGVVIGPQSVITNCHVIDRAIRVRVHAGDKEYSATSGISDTYFDLCMLHVDGLSAPEVRRGSMKNLQVGQTVYAIGAPQGLDRTLSQGLISALREMNEGTVIQTSAAISPGSSGGGLFDAEGRLVGITTFQAKSGQNLNFAVPVDWLDTMRTR